MRTKLLALFAFAALGCSNEEPNTQPTPPLVTEAGVPQPASPRRTVGHRNPFGDVLQADNLVADGDFELTGRNDQAPWYAFDSSGQITLNYDTGGHCRSGVRCAVIAPNQQLVGYMASPAQTDFVVRAYVKPDSGRCSDPLLVVIDLANQGTQSVVKSTTGSPGDDGWCLFMATATNLAYEQPMLYFEIQGQQTSSVVIDQVSVLPVDEVPAHNAPIHLPAPSADTMKRVAFVTDWIRRHRIAGRPSVPPEHARRDRFVAP
jgi:hypothetical protein